MRPVVCEKRYKYRYFDNHLRSLNFIAVQLFSILRQVMPIAAGLGGGLAPSTFAVVSRTIGWGLGRGPGGGMRMGAYVADWARQSRGARANRYSAMEPRA